MIDRKLQKHYNSMMRQMDARRWLEGERPEDWAALLRQSNGDVEVASKAAEAIMLVHWAQPIVQQPLRLFRLFNTAGTMLLVLAESERQARAIALWQNHLRDFDNGDCEEVIDCTSRWGAGFASAVERAKAQGFAGPIERKGNHAVMGDRVYSPLTAV